MTERIWNNLSSATSTPPAPHPSDEKVHICLLPAHTKVAGEIPGLVQGDGFGGASAMRGVSDTTDVLGAPKLGSNGQAGCSFRLIAGGSG